MLHRDTKALVVLALCVVVVFLGFLLTSTEGHFVPQVVDLYLVCQYARAMAEGHPFHYNAGEAASTGATSLLHTTLLAAAHAAGARGEGLVAFAVLTGGLLYLGSVLLARRIGLRLGGEREGLLAGALVALGGPVVWGFLYGSDIALFMFLCLWFLDRLLAEWNLGRLSGTAAAGSLLSLARPEGLLIGVILGAAWSAGPGRGARRGARAVGWLPAVTGLAVVALHRAVTGLWLGTSVADKSLLANYGLAGGIALVSEYGVDVLRGLLLGFYPSEVPLGLSRGWAPFYFPPLGLILMILSVVRPPEALRPPLRLWALMVALLFAFLAPNVFMGVHFNRYLMWAFPTLLALTAAGLGILVRLAAAGDEPLERALYRGGAGLFVLLGLLSTLRFGAHYGEMAGEVYRRDVKTADWIAKSLPRGAGMANLATSVEYLTGHRTVNLHGVVSPAFFGNRMAEREAGVFEALGRLPAAERPPYLITSVSAQEGNPSMAALVEGEPLFRSSSFGDELLVYRMRYDLVGKNGRLFLPEALRAVEKLAEVDRLNVCDSRDEADHDYSFSSSLGNLGLNGTARVDSYRLPQLEQVIDGGRVILGSESFRVRTVRGKDLVMAMRTASSASANILRAAESGRFGLEIPEAAVLAEVEGQSAGRWAFRPRPGWDEQVVRIPGSLVREGHTHLILSGRYASFYYWFYQ